MGWIGGHMEIIWGTTAFSTARIHRILEILREHSPSLDRLIAQYVYFLDIDEIENDERWQRILQILQGTRHDASTLSGSLALVVPRPGTMSPWSTKATDIFHLCGLGGVKRIERGIAYILEHHEWNPTTKAQIHDRMTEVVLSDLEAARLLFRHGTPQPVREIPLLSQGRKALAEVNRDWGMALDEHDMEHLIQCYRELGRNPQDIELMMFAQANSEHCRHKIFRAEWTIHGQRQEHSLFPMIQHTYHHHPAGVLSAYRDNAAVMVGHRAQRFFPDGEDCIYRHHEEDVHILMKVETHNHPTGISPYPGAATGAGGEIRDEGATGRGAKPKAGLVGFSVSHLHLPNLRSPWELDRGQSPRMASAFAIMRDAPLGAASYNNEFGRPTLCGYFRTFAMQIPGVYGPEFRGYHKPIMVAGGMGNIRPMHVAKQIIPDGAWIFVLGGAAMLIGLGGGAASSMATGVSAEHLDFASVQRDNAEMQRRCQEVIDCCWSMGDNNPILSIHDVGAGGLSNAIPELIHDSERGGRLELREIPNDESAMSPLELWCNESQERYVLAIAREQRGYFEAICQRERCPYAVLGVATSEPRLQVSDRWFQNMPIDIPMSVLFGKWPPMHRTARTEFSMRFPLDRSVMRVEEAALRILRFPAVAAKTFLITIGDRSITGMVVQEPMIGPWQVPVADVAVTTTSLTSYTGEAMAMGERPPVALLSPAASGRLAVAEAVTNLAAARITQISDIKLSANWMVAAGHPGEDAALYQTVHAVAMELCPALNLTIPVGKDSMSMKSVWQEGGTTTSVVAPLSLIVSGFAPVSDCRTTLTPQLQTDPEGTILVLIDLGRGQNRLGASCLAQVYNQLGDEPPDLDHPALLADFFAAIQQLAAAQRILAYHDRSDGGLWACLCEMAFAGNTGIRVSLDALGGEPFSILFAEELGAVVQIRQEDWSAILACFASTSLAEHVHRLGTVTVDYHIDMVWQGTHILRKSLTELYKEWEQVSHSLRLYRDNPDCVWSEYQSLGDPDDPGLHFALTFEPQQDVAAPFIQTGVRPAVAILREQGVNGQVEMAAAFDLAGFQCVDVHMTDILEQRVSLSSFQGLVACGGFSYGDVLGAGAGWAQSILLNPVALREFSQFFARTNTFGLGVCNGCQMMSYLKDIIPGASHWPHFGQNHSERFEARWCMVEVQSSPSIFLQGMDFSRLPVVVAHGEGCVVGAEEDLSDPSVWLDTVCLRYVEHSGQITTRYPMNPNGSPQGMTGFCNQDGRFTIMMPHPERVFRQLQHTWSSQRQEEYSPWMRMFRNARAWVG